MTIEMFKETLLWCMVINYAILLLWFSFFTTSREWIFNLHSRWFRLSEERFDDIHYAGMAIFKILIFIFNLAPFIALSIIR